jgi:hypothetical protein
MRSPRAVILVAALGGSLASACHRSLESTDAQTASKDADVSSDVPGESTADHPLACYPLFHACTTTDECCAPNRCLNITGTPACQQEGPAVDADRSETAADTTQNDGGQEASACYQLFHACTSSEQCCAPNLCLTINGGPACQVEGPARTQFTSWASCGWTSSETCLCDGIRACEAVAGGSFSALGSRQARVCAIEGDVCEYVVFVETEGGGKARRCRTPINAGPCLGGIGNATDTNCVDLFTCNLLMGTCPPDIMPGTSVISCR